MSDPFASRSRVRRPWTCAPETAGDLAAGGVDDAHLLCFVEVVGLDARKSVRGDQDAVVAFAGAVDGGARAVGVVASGEDHGCDAEFA